MTHEELIARLADLHNKYSDAGEPAIKQYQGMLLFYSALKSVVELHKPNFEGACHFCVCEHVCDEDTWQVAYPCQTIQAIEKELK